jgi:hypothetical protein
LKNYNLTPNMSFEILDSIIMRLRMMNLGLIINLEYFWFGPLIFRIYILVPELLNITIWSLYRSGHNWWWFMGEILVWLCIYSLVQFWIIVVLVLKPRRLNLVFFMHWNLLFILFWVAFEYILYICCRFS